MCMCQDQEETGCRRFASDIVLESPKEMILYQAHPRVELARGLADIISQTPVCILLVREQTSKAEIGFIELTPDRRFSRMCFFAFVRCRRIGILSPMTANKLQDTCCDLRLLT
jgi:hypothetical protein